MSCRGGYRGIAVIGEDRTRLLTREQALALSLDTLIRAEAERDYLALLDAAAGIRYDDDEVDLQ